MCFEKFWSSHKRYLELFTLIWPYWLTGCKTPGSLLSWNKSSEIVFAGWLVFVLIHCYSAKLWNIFVDFVMHMLCLYNSTSFTAAIFTIMPSFAVQVGIHVEWLQAGVGSKNRGKEWHCCWCASSASVRLRGTCDQIDLYLTGQIKAMEQSLMLTFFLQTQ